MTTIRTKYVYCKDSEKTQWMNTAQYSVPINEQVEPNEWTQIEHGIILMCQRMNTYTPMNERFHQYIVYLNEVISVSCNHLFYYLANTITLLVLCQLSGFFFIRKVWCEKKKIASFWCKRIQNVSKRRKITFRQNARAYVCVCVCMNQARKIEIPITWECLERSS